MKNLIAAAIAALISIPAIATDCERTLEHSIRSEISNLLRIERLQAENHELLLTVMGGESSFAASRKALPNQADLKAAFKADEAAWGYSCRSPQLIQFSKSLQRISTTAAKARLSDLMKVGPLPDKFASATY